MDLDERVWVCLNYAELYCRGYLCILSAFLKRQLKVTILVVSHLSYFHSFSDCMKYVGQGYGLCKRQHGFEM